MHLVLVTPEDVVNLEHLVHAGWETFGSNADGTPRRKLMLWLSAPEAVGVADSEWSTGAYSVALADGENARRVWQYIAGTASDPGAPAF